jgi:hypothetical protein
VPEVFQARLQQAIAIVLKFKLTVASHQQNYHGFLVLREDGAFERECLRDHPEVIEVFHAAVGDAERNGRLKLLGDNRFGRVGRRTSAGASSRAGYSISTGSGLMASPKGCVGDGGLFHGRLLAVIGLEIGRRGPHICLCSLRLLP